MHGPDFRHDSPAEASKKQASIVVVDPSPLSLIATAGVMHSRGYQCICARTADSAIEALKMGNQDLVLWDVADDAAAVLESIESMRQIPGYDALSVVMIAENRWAGLEKKAEAMKVPTRCLFKPIDPNALLAVVDHLLWMPSLIAAHRRRGSKPSRLGWITL
ncbi:hypothetical protein [Novipirellula caenicola]|uniref:Response regulatory domain-containing protein n=1 Tax=Novipirellula caenicola TaxID=1536901 RepID=A0ABP9VUL6_9BACT